MYTLYRYPGQKPTKKKKRVNNLVNGMTGVAWNSHGLTFSTVEDCFSGQEIHS
jgi:hypothetical protein